MICTRMSDGEITVGVCREALLQKWGIVLIFRRSLLARRI